MKIFRLPKTSEEFWRGIYSFKKKSLVSSQVGAEWKWWLYQEPTPPAPKVDGVGHGASRGIRNRVGGSFPAYLLKYKNLVVRTQIRQTGLEALGYEGSSPVMRMSLDWGMENTWYERPPPVAVVSGNTGVKPIGSYHIRTFSSVDGYASKSIEVKLRTKGVQAPIRIQATRGFEVSKDGLSFYPSIAISQIGKDMLPRGFLNTKFHIRKAGGFFLGIRLVSDGIGGQMAIPVFEKGRVVAETFPLKATLNLGMIGDPNYKQAGNWYSGVEPALADRMRDEQSPFSDGGAAFNLGLRYGGGVEVLEGFY